MPKSLGRKVKIRVPTEDQYGYSTKIIRRIPQADWFGNFVMLTIRWGNQMWIIGDGDEYLRGEPTEFELGGKVKNMRR